MANRRMLSKSISTSVQVNKLSCFQAKLLFTWMIPHADDDGRLKGEPEYVKAIVVPMINWLPNDVQKYLKEMHELGLIHMWEEDGQKFIHFPKWKSHQVLQKDRYHKSTFPPCPICIHKDWIQAGYNLETESNLIKSKSIQEKEGEEREMEFEEEPQTFKEEGGE